MFVGHYTAAFAAKAVKTEIPLWHLFIAVQLVDFAWAILVLLGIEKLNLTPGFMEASILDLHHMPYTHSLPATVLWALGAGLAYGLLYRKSRRAVMLGGVIAVAVASHWFLDLIAHGPDLLLYSGGPYVGFGLWNSLVWTQVVEIGGLALTGALFIWAVRPKRWQSWLAALGLIVFMAVLQIYNHLPVDHPPAIPVFAITALFAYSLLVLAAAGVDRSLKGDATLVEK